MIIHIIAYELRHNILSLRLHLALLLTFVLFGIGSAAFVANQRISNTEYREYESKKIEALRKISESNFSKYATTNQTWLTPPRADSFIDDARERYLPNSFLFSAYDVFDAEVSPLSANPFLKKDKDLSWMYIVAIIIGFVVFLFSFDAVSGEKEARTLALALSNQISRATLLFSKYLSTILTALLVLFPGLCISLIIVFLTGTVPLTPLAFGEISLFFLAVTMYVACIAAFGMLSSVLARAANVSLLIAISFWLLFVAIVPNTALFWGQALFPIKSAQEISMQIQKEREDINRNAPKGSGASSSADPFLPQHKLRAEKQMKLMMSDKRIRDAWIQEMIRQVERTRLITFLSPMSLFEYLSEAVVGGGYMRLRKNLDDLHIFQERFLAFFKEKDAADKDSPHWYNPYEDFSTTKKPVSFKEVPLYSERTISLTERLAGAGAFFLIMGLYTLAVFALTFVLFLRYDAR
jgi:ABC-type transport system involved in multi-copper enzyme maturation permease subunit